MANKIFSIIVPVYHNEGSLNDLFRELDKVEESLSKIEVSCQFIFVNDGSRDSSLEILKNHQRNKPGVVLLNHLANRGSMAALKTGMRHVTGDCFTFLAADLQDPPSLLPEMVEAWKSGEKFVVRTRASRSDPLLSKIFSWVNYRIVKAVIMPSFPAGGFDMAVMDKAFLTSLLRCGHNKNISMFAWSLGIPAKILTYHRQERSHGVSQWSLKKKVNYFIDSSVGFSVRPMRIATTIGFIISIFCFIYATVVITGKLLGLINVPGFAAIAALLGLLNGFTFIFLGVLGEYVWRIYQEMDRHPDAIVEIIVPQQNV